MSTLTRTAIVTGASQGIGAGIVRAFLNRGYSVVANSRRITKSAEVAPSENFAVVEGDIGRMETAETVAATAVSRFGAIDVLVNNAGLFFTKPFTEYTADDFRSLVSTNLEGFLYITQLTIREMLAHKTGGAIVTITAALTDNPIQTVTASVPMMTKGGLEAVTRHLAMEYAKDRIRVNAVAPGVVDTPRHRDTPQAVMERLSPMGRTSTVENVAAAVLYLEGAPTVTGSTLYVDGGSHLGSW